MRTFKIILKYDGTNYFGWQRQKNLKSMPSVQGVLEVVLEKIFKKRISTTGAGRTDAGVHARGQAASFRVLTRMKAKDIRKALNAYFPEDIYCSNILEVSDSFHPRFGVKEKTYRYELFCKKEPCVFNRLYTVHYPYQLKLPLMKKAAKFLEGKHDFSTIAAGKNENSIRTIKNIKIRSNKHVIRIDVTGDGFLYKMVRRIAGLLIDVGREKIGPKDVQNLIKDNKTTIKIQTAPAKGLTLLSVKY